MVLTAEIDKVCMECVGSWQCNTHVLYSMQADREHAMQIQGTNACHMPTRPMGATMSNMQPKNLCWWC